MAERRTRILVADDHALLREAVCELLCAEADFEVVARTGDAETAVRLVVEHRPDVALLDIRMPHNEDPAATVRRMLGRHPGLRIVVVSADDDPRTVGELVAAGACGYVHKSASWQTMTAAVRQSGDPGRAVVTLSLPAGRPAPEAGATGSAGGAGGAGEARLSAREVEVLALVADALSNRQIGARLGITEGTVKRHLRNLFEKLGAVSRIDAVNKAVAAGLVRPRRTAA
ncbi:response regulator transcription factor [Kitasatospora sp. NPDC057198]|uniref:response regulator transcription factor n=1 Tax=Kitasatospora sp. NPDC057198 TaxID=3346046 RepID=UPI0036443203